MQNTLEFVGGKFFVASVSRPSLLQLVDLQTEKNLESLESKLEDQ